MRLRWDITDYGAVFKSRNYDLAVSVSIIELFHDLVNICCHISLRSHWWGDSSTRCTIGYGIVYKAPNSILQCLFWITELFYDLVNIICDVSLESSPWEGSSEIPQLIISQEIPEVDPAASASIAELIYDLVNVCWYVPHQRSRRSGPDKMQCQALVMFKRLVDGILGVENYIYINVFLFLYTHEVMSRWHIMDYGGFV